MTAYRSKSLALLATIFFSMVAGVFHGAALWCVLAASVLTLAAMAKVRTLALTNLFVWVLLITLCLIVSYYSSDPSQAYTQSAISVDADARSDNVWYCACGTLFLIIGAFVAPWRATNTKSVISPWREGAYRSQHTVLYLAIGFVPVVLNVLLYAILFRGESYVAVHLASFGPLKYILFSILLTQAVIVLMFAGYYGLKRAHRTGVIILVLSYIILYGVLLNVRSYLFVVFMYWLYFFGPRFKTVAVVASTGAILVSFVVIGHYRDENFRRLGDVQTSAMRELGGMGDIVDTITYAMAVLDEGGPQWGYTYVAAFGDISVKPSVQYAQRTAYQYYEAGGGFGFFYIAEMLINFGFAGMLLCMAGLGYFLMRINVWQWWFAVAVIRPVLLGSSFLLIRNDFTSSIKTVLYVLISAGLLLSIGRRQKASTSQSEAFTRRRPLPLGGLPLCK